MKKKIINIIFILIFILNCLNPEIVLAEIESINVEVNKEE